MGKSKKGVECCCLGGFGVSLLERGGWGVSCDDAWNVVSVETEWGGKKTAHKGGERTEGKRDVGEKGHVVASSVAGKFLLGEGRGQG